jgi:hypothetical protein
VAPAPENIELMAAGTDRRLFRWLRKGREDLFVEMRIGDRFGPLGRYPSDLSAAAQRILVLRLTGACANVGLLSLYCSRPTLASQAPNDQNQQYGNRDDAEDEAHHTAERNGICRSIYDLLR